MLGPTYRYQIVNNTGVSVTATIKDRRWKFGTTGAQEYAAESTPANAVAVAAGGAGNGGTVDNSSTAYLGAMLTVSVSPSASATGVVAVYLQRSTDGGTTWPSDRLGVQVGAIMLSASTGTTASNMTVR